MRLVGLFLVVLLVVGVGVGVTPDEPQAPVYSAAERAQLDAEGRYRALAEDAREAAVADPALADALVAAADDLVAQADAVALPRSTTEPPAGSTSPGAAPGATGPAEPSDSSDPSDPSDPAVPAPAPADAAGVLALLRDSALHSLSDAVGAEPGPARVLASAGANQWRHAVLLGALLGADAGLPSADAVPTGDLAGSTGLFAAVAPAAAPSSAPSEPGAGPSEPGAGPSGPGAGPSEQGTDPSGPGADPSDPSGPDDCAGTPRGPEADRKALLSAKTAEDRARFGYEVAAALLPDPPAMLARSSLHGAAADDAARRLEDLCAPAAPAPAGFAIGPDFRADPAAALRHLEQEHAGLYAGLIPAVGPDARPWAVVSFNAAAQRSLDAGTPLGAFPGLDDGAADATAAEEPADG